MLKLAIAALLLACLASAAPVAVDQHDMHADALVLTAENALVSGFGRGA